MAYLATPAVIAGMILVPSVARWVATTGVIIMCLSLGLSSFASNVTHLILSQGIGFGVGGCMAYSPSFLFMSEWFDKRKGLAFGISWVSDDQIQAFDFQMKFRLTIVFCRRDQASLVWCFRCSWSGCWVNMESKPH